MKYARLKNRNWIEFPDKTKPGVSNYHLSTKMLIADGFKPYDDSCPCPNDNKQYMAYYEDRGDKIVRLWEEITIPQKTYFEKRANEYPPVTEYLDAMVKINSGDEAMVVAGQEQLAAYYEYCLAVKAKYPKPETNEEENADVGNN